LYFTIWLINLLVLYNTPRCLSTEKTFRPPGN
jgi:hypothetical protein